MERFEIDGPAVLSGRVDVSGAKNAALPALAASLLTSDPIVLGNLPNVQDVRTMHQLLRRLGVRFAPPGEEGESTDRLRAQPNLQPEAPYDLVKTMRASILVLGPLVAREGHARVSLPGGCAIGARPVDLHLAALEKMGAEIAIDQGDIVATVPGGRLHGAEIDFPKVTVTGTENILMAAALAKGTSVLRSSALEPEVVDLCRLLRKMGARIEGEGTSELRVEGVDVLHGAEHDVIADRIETGTWVIAGALVGDGLEIGRCRPADLDALLSLLGECGVRFDATEDTIRISRADGLVARNVETEPHPGFPTDLQAQMMVLLTQAEGRAKVRETIFESRFQHAFELARMGAKIALDGDTATVTGPTPLTGTNVMASDLRASAALVLAGLVASGTTTVHRTYHLRRGYADMDDKLAAVGAVVRSLG